MNYEEFISRKLVRTPPTGLATVPELSDKLFPFQKEIVGWALKRGRAAVFADTGLGKTRMQLEWAKCVADATGSRVLILAPLAVASQTAKEGASIGVNVQVSREPEDIGDARIIVTNYDRIHKYSPDDFGAVVLDESSIIKHQTSKTFSTLTDMFARTAFKLCATATPSPNDYTELGTHAEFLGICTRQEMLAEFFCHDGGETQVWRLKGHARTAFWKWIASWGALLRKPSDLGHSDEGYNLPGLNVYQHTIAADADMVKESGFLFAQEATDLMDRRRARKASLSARVTEVSELVMVKEKAEKFVVWCDLNVEQDLLAQAFGDDCVSVYGSLDADEKERRVLQFLNGERRILLSKSSICGFGINIQTAARMVFVGVTDSYESYYQAVRRCYRFGQRREVDVHIYASEVEGSVVKNLARKEAESKKMAEELSSETRDAVRAEVHGQTRTTNVYKPGAIVMPKWLVSETT